MIFKNKKNKYYNNKRFYKIIINNYLKTFILKYNRKSIMMKVLTIYILIYKKKYKTIFQIFAINIKLI